MKKEEMKYPIDIFNEINPSELAENKIWIDIQPVDDWESWSYKIYFEDTGSPFFLVHSEGQESHFKTYARALSDAIDWLSTHDYINIIELPF